MKKFKPKKESFLGILTRNYIVFSVVVVLLTAGLFLLGNFLAANEDFALPKKDVSDYDGHLRSGEYGEIPYARFLGRNGYMTVTDVYGNVVWSTQSAPRSYTVGELDLIQTLNDGYSIEVASFNVVGGVSNYLVTRTSKDDLVKKEYILLDEKLNVLSSSGTLAPTAQKLTQEEFRLLTYNFYNKGDQTLYKYAFKAENGSNMFVVMMDTMGTVNRAPAIILGVIIALCAVIYFILLTIFTFITNKAVQKPLLAFDNALFTLSNSGDYGTKIEFEGAVEFERLAERFNAMTDRLNESERSKHAAEEDKRRMLAGLSHDLKTPLTIIQGFADALKDNVASEADRERYLNVIIQKANEMTSLVNVFGEYNKLNHPEYAPQLKKTDLGELTREYFISHLDEIEFKGFTFEADVCEEKLPVLLDADSFTRVFDNLLSNTLKYNGEGTAIKVSVISDKKEAVVIFADNGVGISDVARESVFQPFVVGEESRSKQGSGLGLAICERIMSSHGGTIKLLPPAEGATGAVFELRLPISGSIKKFLR